MWEVVVLPHFKKVLKPLAKKHRDLLLTVLFELKNFDKNRAIKITEDVYKIRISPSSLPKGKSGGFRLYVLVMEIRKRLAPITIYYKSEKENLTLPELKDHLAIIMLELKDHKV